MKAEISDALHIQRPESARKTNTLSGAVFGGMVSSQPPVSPISGLKSVSFLLTANKSTDLYFQVEKRVLFEVETNIMNGSSRVRIFVVDDHKMFVEGLMELLSSESDFEIVGHASSIAESKRSVRGANPDIVLLDIALPDGDGYSIHEWLADTYGDAGPKVLYVTGDDRLSSIKRAMSLGGMAYLDKTGGWEEVAIAIRRAAMGSKTLGTNIAAKLADFSFNSDSSEQRLSVRESEILAGISEGLTAKEMSSQMGLALTTVRTYVSRLFNKLGAKDRAHAVSIGYIRGLIEP